MKDEHTLPRAEKEAASPEKSIEILAPVGSPETLQAAVWAGADSVYLGLQGFNARRGAGNFTPEELKSAVAFCHTYGARVHVTLNTLVFADELPRVKKCVEAVCEAGADAVIVQDWGVARLVRECAPGLRLHGSTQMAVCDLAGARELAAMGFSRAILARELSEKEIALITRDCGIETEVFVHGAQCMCVSGQCYMSAFLGGRSGNRGGCAQPCRLPFTAFEDKAPAATATALGNHHLSLKDLSLIAQLPHLAALGVKCVKIEGRLRPPEYVAAAVHACVQARAGRPFDEKQLADVFSRSGFTDGYYAGHRGPQMFGIRRPEDAALTRSVQPQIREFYRRPPAAVGVALAFTLEEEGAKLSAHDGRFRAVAYADETPQPSESNRYEDAVRRSLEKTGGTPFYAASVTLSCAPGLYLPLSQVNTLRRRVLDELAAKRAEPAPVPFSPEGFAEKLSEDHPDTSNDSARTPDTASKDNFLSPDQNIPADQRAFAGPTPDDAQRAFFAGPKLFGRFESFRQVPDGAAERLDGLILPLAEAAVLPAEWREKTVLEVPRGNFGGTERLEGLIAAAAAKGFRRFEANNIGHLALLRDFSVSCGFPLNVLNPAAAETLARQGVSTFTLAPELRLSELPAFAGYSFGLIAYGHLPVMMTRACPLSNITECAACCKKGRLLDRKGMEFPVVCRGSVREIFNPVPLWLGDRQRETCNAFLTLYFTRETPERVERVLALFEAGEPYDGKFTRGLYYREKED